MPNQKFYSLWLCLIIVIIFILQLIIPNLTELLVLNQKALTNLEIHRFVTSIFLHGSPQHLLFNLFALLYFGLVAEKLIGSKKFLILFFSSGIIANIISINFYNSSLGASGAIMGLIGLTTIIRPMMMVWSFGIILPMFLASIVWVIGDVLGIFFPDGTGNIAHLSGIAIGALYAIIIKENTKSKTKSLRKFTKEKPFKLPDYVIKNWEDRYMK